MSPFLYCASPKVTSAHANRIWGGTLIRVFTVVGAVRAGIKKKRDVEEKSRDCSRGILYVRQKLSSVEVCTVM